MERNATSRVSRRMLIVLQSLNEVSHFWKLPTFSNISGNDWFDRAVLNMPESFSHYPEVTENCPQTFQEMTKPDL